MPANIRLTWIRRRRGRRRRMNDWFPSKCQPCRSEILRVDVCCVEGGEEGLGERDRSTSETSILLPGREERNKHHDGGWVEDSISITADWTTPSRTAVLFLAILRSAQRLVRIRGPPLWLHLWVESQPGRLSAVGEADACAYWCQWVVARRVSRPESEDQALRYTPLRIDEGGAGLQRLLAASVGEQGCRLVATRAGCHWLTTPLELRPIHHPPCRVLQSARELAQRHIPHGHG